MTIKLTVSIEPVDETARVTVTRDREGADQFYSSFVVLTSITSPAIEVEVGDRLQIAVEPNHAIVLDDEQFCVRLEDPNKGEIKEQREKKKQEEKEAEEELKKDRELRAKEATRLKQLYNKEAEQTKVPVKAVPFPAPLPEAEAESPRPPRGGAMDSREVKGK